MLLVIAKPLNQRFLKKWAFVYLFEPFQSLIVQSIQRSEEWGQNNTKTEIFVTVIKPVVKTNSTTHEETRLAERTAAQNTNSLFIFI